MCGIAGIIRQHSLTCPGDLRAVDRMLCAQAHRGPDDSGVHSDTRVVLGHRRLSIIDLSATGHQPMCNEDGTVWITYNGELYNYRELFEELRSRRHEFRSKSDTEVLVHGYEEWGIDGLLSRARGMFAFGLYDGRGEPALILARDRLGIKPLYYFRPPDGELMVFASEVKALLSSGMVPDERDSEALTRFLLFGFVPSPSTTIKHVHCLPAGHYLMSSQRGVRLKQYWDFQYSPEAADSITREEAEAALKEKLEDSVARHMISDVPVGVFLSGGVDSAGLVALASRSTAARLTTLTVSFEEQDFSEAKPARQIARNFQTEHHEVLVTGDTFMRELPKILEAMDQPTNDGVNTYFVSKAARECGLTVVLSGLGGDEVFWGYRHYHWLRRFKKEYRWFSAAPGLIRNTIIEGGAAYGRMRGQERWMRLAYLAPAVSDTGTYLLLRGFFAPQQVAELAGLSSSQLKSDVAQVCESMQAPASSGAVNGNGFNYIEMKRYMHDQLLRDADVFSMAHSIEVRVPYLDHSIVEFVNTLPAELKMQAGLNKPLLVNAVNDPLVSQAAKQKKMGFAFPFARWMKQHASELEELAVDSGGLDSQAVKRVWTGFSQGRVHWSRAWATVVVAAKSPVYSASSI